MSILIKGMEMPKDKEITLCIDEKGEVYIYGSYPTELYSAVELPPHGKWIDGGKSAFFPNDDIWACSICDRHYFMKHKFCPHCGAKMAIIESEENK